MLHPIEANALGGEPGIRHGFFTRRGGVSTGLYAGLNCGLGSRDDPALVAENRSLVARHLGVSPQHLLSAYQVHGAETIEAARPWSRETMPRADAIVTATPGLAIGVLTADCAPVLLADPQARVIGAAHAGWKGAVAGILDSTVAAMVRLGARRERIRAAVGPCIGVGAYEVGPEFEAELLRAHPANYQFFERPKGGGRAHFDLGAYVVTRLRLLRIDRIEDATRCTYESESDFFSYRRSVHAKEADYGRQISAIVLA